MPFTEIELQYCAQAIILILAKKEVPELCLHSSWDNDHSFSYTPAASPGQESAAVVSFLTVLLLTLFHTLSSREINTWTLQTCIYFHTGQAILNASMKSFDENR